MSSKKDNRKGLLLPLAVGAGLFFLLNKKGKAKTPEEVASDYGESCPSVGAGVGAIADAPYNNPGAIISSSVAWEGKKTYPHQCFYESFESPYYGWRALYLNLNSYLNLGVDTIGEIIPMWAGNDAPNYRAFVLSELQKLFPGITNNQVLSAGSPELFELGLAISKYENASEFYPILQSQFNDAEAAFNDVFP